MVTHAKPPRLFSFPPEVELESLRGAGLRGQAEDELRAVLYAFAAIATAKRLTATVLQPVIDGCGSESDLVRGIALHRLVVLGHYFPEAREAIRGVCSTGRVDVRLQALTHIVSAPRNLATKVVKSSLGDGDIRIRRQALKLVRGLASRRLEQELILRLEKEEDESLKSQIRSILAAR